MAFAPASKKPAEAKRTAKPRASIVQPSAASPGVPLHVRADGMSPRHETPTTSEKGAGAALGGERIVALASQGVANADEKLPHLDKIQASFGAHDVSGVRAAIGGDGGAAARQMGARGYAVGDRVAFRDQPDLRLAAHEAAHVVQQRGGVQLKDNVGRPGDHYERQADYAADAVVAGRSAESILGSPKGGGKPGVQMACASCGGGGGSCPSCSDQAVVQMELDPLAVREFDGAAIVEGVGGGGGEAAKSGAKGAAKPADAEAAAPAESGGAEQAAAKSEEKVAPQDDPVAKVGATIGAMRCPEVAEAPRAKEKEQGEEDEACHEDPDYFKPITPEQRAEDERKAKAGELNPPNEPAGVDVKAESSPPQGNSPEKSADGKAPPEPKPPKECAPDKPEKPPSPPPVSEQPEEPLPSPPGMDPELAQAILLGEERRAAAISEFELASDEGRAADDRLADVGRRSIRFAPPAEDVEAQQKHSRANEVASRGISEGVREARDVFEELRPQIPRRVAAKLTQGKLDIDLACDRAKASIRAEFANARASAHREATLSKIMVDLHYMLAVIKATVGTLTAAGEIEKDKQAKIKEASTIESEKLGALDEAVTKGQDAVRQEAEDRGEDAMKKGRQWHASYSRGRPLPKDGFWEGYVSDRRAAARAKAALTTAAGFRDSFKQEGENQAFQISRGKAPKCARIVATAFATRVGIGQNGTKFAQMVRDGLPAQLDTLKSARGEFHKAIDKALHRQLLTLSYQESAQLQAAEDTAYAKKLTLEQQAHAAVARLSRSVSKASDDVVNAFATMRETLEGRDAPEDAVLAKAIHAARASVRARLARMRDDLRDGIEAAETSLGDQTVAALDALLRLADGAVEEAQKSASAFADQQSNLRANAGESFTSLSEAYQKQLEALKAAATKSFACAVASLRETANASVKEVVDGAESVRKSLNESFTKELGNVDAKIQHYACKAAEKEQPAWKEVLAVVLIIIIIIVAIIAFGPLALALSGGVAISLGGAIAAGAIIGALSAAATTIVSNWADGQKWHKGVVKAMVVGAITGAIGGAFGGGAGGGWVGKAGSFIGQVGRQVVADVVSSMIGQVIGGLVVDGRLEMPHYSVKDFMMSVFMAALFAKGKIPRRLTKGPGARAKALRGFEHVQEFAHNVAGAFMPGGRFRPGAAGGKGSAPPPEGAARPGEQAPAQPTETPPSRPGEKPGVPDATTPKAAASEHGTPIERSGPEAPRETAHDARAAERTPHHDAPEIEPGTNVVARESSVGDHTVSVTRDGKVVVCSTCGELAKVFEPELAEFGLQHELVAIEGMSNPQAKAAAAARLHAKLVGLRNIANRASGTPVAGGDPAGALAKVRGVASEMRMPEAVVAQHAQELIRTGRHPEGVPPEGPYGQRLLKLAEALVGPRVHGGEPLAAQPAEKPATTEEAILAKEGADIEARATTAERGKEIARVRAEGRDPELKGAFDQVADVVADPSLQQGSRKVKIGGREFPHGRKTRANDGVEVLETKRGEGNLFVEHLGTYRAIEKAAARLASKLGVTPREFVEIFLQTIQTGTTPRVSSRAALQVRTAKLMAKLQRLLFASEVVRSPTQLSDTVQVLRVMANENSLAPLRELSPTAAERHTPGTPERPAELGGAKGAPRAVERAKGAPRRENALDRAADEAFRRHEALLQRDPRYQGMTREQMRDAFVNDIITLLFGGRR